MICFFFVNPQNNKISDIPVFVSVILNKTVKTVFKAFLYVVIVVLLFYVHGKHVRSCRDGQLT